MTIHLALFYGEMIKLLVVQDGAFIAYYVTPYLSGYGLVTSLPSFGNNHTTTVTTGFKIIIRRNTTN